MPRPQNTSVVWLHKFRILLASEVDGASLALFRICFGVVMFVHAVKYIYPQHGTSLKEYLYDSTAFNFTYPGFAWVQPLPEPWWTGVFVMMGLAALGVAVGLFFRVSAAVLFLTYSYIFLSEAAKYNNHYYLMCLLALLLLLTPADRRFSIRSWLQSRKAESTPQTLVPFWSIFILRAQLFLVYFFGGIAKLDSDWLTGIPMIGKGREVLAFWLPTLSVPIEPIHVGLFIAWFGLFFDLSIGFLLLARRTRSFALVLTAAFHISNHFLFPIGLFPIMALSTTLIFCDADWPVRIWATCCNIVARGGEQKRNGTALRLLGQLNSLLRLPGRQIGIGRQRAAHSRPISLRLTLVLACFFVVQVTFPFRHHLIEGDANWTEEAQDFSWRMMLRAKDASHVIYHLVDDEMLVQDEQGNSRVNWERAPQQVDRHLFVPIDCEQFNWSHHPGLTMTYESALGLRAVFRLAPNDAASQLISSLEKQWKSLTNREVRVHESLSLEDAIRQLSELQHAASETVQASVARIRHQHDGMAVASGFAREQILADLAEEVHFLMNHPDASSIRPVLCRLQPFCLQSAASTDSRFLIVDDVELANFGSVPDELSGGSELLVWIDIGRLRPADWERLPNWFVTFENRKINILWNYAAELNSIQKRRFSTSPWMIRQYAHSIADRWQQQTQRRPEVFVTSNIMLNYRLPQALIDPKVDLAKSSYSVFQHNDWILPLTQDVGTAVRTASNPSRSNRLGAKSR
ncbi:MAG: HTTM domain-containing protein [Planctomycetota bacterium]